MRFPAVFLALVLVPAALLAQDPTIRIHAATVLDGTGKMLRNGTILVRGSKITYADEIVERVRQGNQKPMDAVVVGTSHSASR